MAISADELREQVRSKYAELARTATGDGDGCGCGSGECCADTAEGGKFGEALYAAEERGGLPDAAVLASFGCGNPRPSPICTRVRRCSTSAPAGAST